MQLDQLLAARADLWRGHATPAAAQSGLPTGFAALDAALSGHGWPRAGLSEVLTAHQGAGLALLLPLLSDLSKQPRWLLWVDPPHVPFAPALAARGLDLRRILIVRAGADAAWAAEQGLRSGTCAAVLAWTGSVARSPVAPKSDRRTACWTPAALRRLQIAAADTDTPALLLRPPAAAGETSSAMLRLRVCAGADGIDLTLLKQRGGRPGQQLRLPAEPDAVQTPVQTDADPLDASCPDAREPHRQELPAQASPRPEPAGARQIRAVAAGTDAVVSAGTRRGRRRRIGPQR